MKPLAGNSLLGALVEHYEVLVDRLRWRCESRDAARDLIHDACLKLLTSAPDEPVQSPQAFLTRMTRHLAIDRHRVEAGRRRLLPVDADASADCAATSAPGPEQTLEGEQTLQALFEAIDRLPPRCRDVFVLHKLNDVPQREIARRLGISPNMVARHMMRAMQTLRPLIDPEQGK